MIKVVSAQVSINRWETIGLSSEVIYGELSRKLAEEIVVGFKHAVEERGLPEIGESIYQLRLQVSDGLDGVPMARLDSLRGGGVAAPPMSPKQALFILGKEFEEWFISVKNPLDYSPSRKFTISYSDMIRLILNFLEYKGVHGY